MQEDIENSIQRKSDMIIIEITGGLGNQMFQLALYTALKADGKNVKLDLSRYRMFFEYQISYKQMHCFMTDDYEYATKKEIRKYSVGSDLCSRVWIKSFGDLATHRYEKKDYTFDQNILELDHCYLSGFWQAHEYFDNCVEQVRNAFRFRNIAEQEQYNINMSTQITSCESVGVHIRRGDYLKMEDIYGGICTEDYYREAIDYINQNVNNPHYFIFSNDYVWAKDQYPDSDKYTIVHGNDGANSFRDMQLMSMCRHQVIANSSFSWWAAWLNQNDAKKIVAPSRWINDRKITDIYMDSWIRI